MTIDAGRESTNQARHRYVEEGTTVAFFTDPLLCIGCKACEVACKEWNEVPADGYAWSPNSYDHSGDVGASTWRHVLFVEEDRPRGAQVAGPMTEDGDQAPFRWVFLSDVCKHCEVAGCLEACPTGAIVRTEVGAVYVQDDVCNGCGYCVVWCPFGVIDRRPAPLPGAGGAFKCTFCYDRQKGGLTPACAKACPTESILFGPLAELRRRAEQRLAAMAAAGHRDARIYDAAQTSVGGLHAFFLVLGEPERWRLAPHPEVPTRYVRETWIAGLVTALGAMGVVFLIFVLT